MSYDPGMLRRIIWAWMGYPKALPLTEADMRRWDSEWQTKESARRIESQKSITEAVTVSLQKMLVDNAESERRITIAAQIVAHGNSVENALAIADDLIAKAKR